MREGERQRKRLVLLIWLLYRKFCPHEIETCQIVLLVFLESLSLMHGSKVISTVVLGSLAENRKDYCLHCHVLRFGY